MNLVDYVIKFCEAQKVSQKVWSRTYQVHIMVNFLTFMFTNFHLRLKKANSSELSTLPCLNV